MITQLFYSFSGKLSHISHFSISINSVINHKQIKLHTSCFRPKIHVVGQVHLNNSNNTKIRSFSIISLVFTVKICRIDQK